MCNIADMCQYKFVTFCMPFTVTVTVIYLSVYLLFIYLFVCYLFICLFVVCVFILNNDKQPNSVVLLKC